MRFEQDPQARKRYLVDWSQWLDSAEVLDESAWTCDDSDLVLEEADFGDTSASVVLSGGVAGTSYSVVNRITSSSGFIDERTLTLHVREQ